MDITPFIRELLFSHDCVIIPGFGGFIGNYTPARIDKSTSMLYPPVKQISFNRNLNHNDGLLVGRISSHTSLPYGDSRNIVEEFAADLRKKLEKGEKVVFDNIGSFVNNQEGNVQFEPDKAVNYHLDSFGLEPFQFSPLENYDLSRRISKHLDKSPVKHIASRKVFWRAAAVIVPLLAIMVAVPLKTDIFKQKVETSSLNPLTKAEFESNKEAVDNNIPSVTINIPEEKYQSPAPEAVVPVEDQGTYLIIAGSFKLKNNAEALADMLAKEGYTPEIIEGANGFFRVSAMRCTGIQAAESRKDSISEKFPGSWVKKIH
jgi:nucleoid DNA-binding protein